VGEDKVPYLLGQGTGRARVSGQEEPSWLRLSCIKRRNGAVLIFPKAGGSHSKNLEPSSPTTSAMPASPCQQQPCPETFRLWQKGRAADQMLLVTHGQGRQRSRARHLSLSSRRNCLLLCWLCSQPRELHQALPGGPAWPVPNTVTNRRVTALQNKKP